jgi:predicted O-methyltransferase YrrM
MWNILRNALLIIIVVGAIGAYVGYQAYDEKDVEVGSYSRTVREYLYASADKRQERIILAPDIDGEEFRANGNETFTTGLKRTGYTFSSDWHTKKSPAWAEALKDFAGKPNVQYLEVGVYEGRATVWMVENILTHPTSHVTGIDIFIGELSQGSFDFVPESKKLYEDNMLAAGAEGRFTTYADFSQNILRDLPRNYYDIIYIDGGHSGKSVLEDAILSFRLLKVGGVMIFDDYRWFTTAPRLQRPGYAINLFQEFYGEQFEVIHNQYQFILRKTSEDIIDAGLGNLPESN